MSGLKKLRFYHEQTPHGKYNGVTVVMHPTCEEGTVGVATTFCSKNDFFCKREAREAVLKKEVEVIRVLDLPKYLAAKWYASWDPNHFHKHLDRADSNRFSWIWKYFL